MEQLLRVGVVTTTHGVRGEVKVFPTTDDAERFKKLKSVILDLGREKRTLEIEQVRFFKNLVILKFKGLDSMNDVEGFRKKDLLVTREQAVELSEDEYFIADLIGLSVVDEDGERLGALGRAPDRRQRCVCGEDGGGKGASASSHRRMRFEGGSCSPGNDRSCDGRPSGSLSGGTG